MVRRRLPPPDFGRVLATGSVDSERAPRLSHMRLRGRRRRSQGFGVLPVLRAPEGLDGHRLEGTHPSSRAGGFIRHPCHHLDGHPRTFGRFRTNRGVRRLSRSPGGSIQSLHHLPSPDHTPVVEDADRAERNKAEAEAVITALGEMRNTLKALPGGCH
jgi:hypothetical protein